MGEFVGYTLPAFPGGINQNEAIDQFPEIYARNLINLYPNGSKLELRKGISVEWTADAASVDTLASLALLDGTHDMVAACNDAFYLQNGTGSTDITGSTTPTSDTWQWMSFRNILYFCNGEDTMQTYNGTGTMADSTYTGGATPALDTLTYPFSYKNRAYFIAGSSLWYGSDRATGASALVEFPLDAELSLGGFLVAGGSWTNNHGESGRDLLWAYSSEGEIVFYSGEDPGDTAWARVAKYPIGEPLSRRCVIPVENDTWLITSQGIVSIASLFSLSSIEAEEAISTNINPLIRRQALTYPFDTRWSGVFDKAKRRVVINMPISTTNTQHVIYNLEKKAWTIFKYTPTGTSNNLVVQDRVVYTGSTTGIIYEMESGLSDADNNINFEILGGYNFYGSRQQFKHFKDIVPILRTTIPNFTLQIGIDINFQQTSEYATITTPESEPDTYSEWDLAEWDDGPWSPEEVYLWERYSLEGQGHSAALKIAGTIINAELDFSAFEVRFEKGSQV